MIRDMDDSNHNNNHHHHQDSMNNNHNLQQDEEEMDMEGDYGLNDEDADRDNENDDGEGNLNQIRKRRLMKKAPDAPKRFKSAYICFVTEKMDNVKKNMPADIKVTEVMKTLAYMWKNLPPLEKLEYERQAETDKARYFEEMAQYSGPLQVPNKRQKKPPGAPKRAMSAFLSFSQQMRPQIRAMYPDLKNTDISGVLAQKWHNASEEEKRPHLERELREREKYHEDMAQWKEEEQRRQQDAAEARKKNNFVKSTVDFLDLPSSTSLWETLDSDGMSENISEQNDATEQSMPSSSMPSSTTTSNHRMPSMNSGSMMQNKEGGYEHPFHSLASFHSGSALTNKLIGGHKNFSTLQPKGSLKMNQDNNNNNNNNNNGSSSSRSKSQNNNTPNNSSNNVAAIPPSIAIPSNSTTPTNNSSAHPTPMSIYSTSAHPSALAAAALPENRYYAMQYPMVAHPDGQVPYASFSMYPQEYAPYMTYYLPSEKGANPYVRYPYMGPLYARQFATAATQMQADATDSEATPPSVPAAIYPPGYGFPGHPVYPPEYMGGEGYWQYVRKLPTPSAATAGNANNNNGSASGPSKEAGSNKYSPAPSAAGIPHYVYELPPEYMTVPPVAKMSAAAAAAGDKAMEFIPYPYAYAAPLTASYPLPLPATSGKSSKKSHSMKSSPSVVMGQSNSASAPSSMGRQEQTFQQHSSSHSNVAETLRAIHRSGLSGQD